MVDINFVELKTYCHATEDEARVVKAMLNLLPADLRGGVRVGKSVVKGHYGNPIIVYRVIVKGVDASRVVDYIASRLGSIEKSVLRASLSIRFDSRSRRLYIRFDKQELYNDRLVISDGDDIVHLMISFKGRGRVEDIRRLLSEKGLL